ncbi:hypothetical protein QE152_g8708 [Popillia japonica]|uniref:Uncharacterized protein n=1 Tax=Popillia japonica TaxID=7064 RepID=A0AAW1M1V8_POPJA
MIEGRRQVIASATLNERPRSRQAHSRKTTQSCRSRHYYTAPTFAVWLLQIPRNLYYQHTGTVRSSPNERRDHSDIPKTMTAPIPIPAEHRERFSSTRTP